jgi:putative RecB family exonuclease
MKNQLVVQILNDVANMLDMQGVKWEPFAYRRAARTIESLAEPIEQIYAEGKLEDLPGVGEGIAKKIGEIIETGSLKYRDELKAKTPIDLEGLLAVEGIGPKMGSLDQFSSLLIKHEQKEHLKRQYSVAGDILTFRRCKRQYGMYKLRCYRPAKTIQFYFGTVIHQTLDLAHEHYLGRLDPTLKSTVPSDEQIQSYFLAAESSLRTRGIVPFSRTQRESALKLLRRFNRHYGPKLYPRVRDTECRLQMDLGKVVMQGVVDVLLTSPASRGLGIWDYKGSELPSGEKMRRILHDYELQMRVYSLLYSHKYGDKPDEAVLVFLNELKSDPPTREEERRAFFQLKVNSAAMKDALTEFMESVEMIENERVKTGIRWEPPSVRAIPERRNCDVCDFRCGCESAIAAYGYKPLIPKAV